MFCLLRPHMASNYRSISSFLAVTIFTSFSYCFVSWFPLLHKLGTVVAVAVAVHWPALRAGLLCCNFFGQPGDGAHAPGSDAPVSISGKNCPKLEEIWQTIAWFSLHIGAVVRAVYCETTTHLRARSRAIPRRFHRLWFPTVKTAAILVTQDASATSTAPRIRPQKTRVKSGKEHPTIAEGMQQDRRNYRRISKQEAIGSKS